jgi:integrase
MGSREVNTFLTHLAVDLHVSASTQNQALAALLFLYRELLQRDLDLEGVIRARTRRRLPVVMTVAEVRAVLERMDGVEALLAGLLYGGGLRLMEGLRLRVHDLDFQRWQITVRDGKGGKDRRTMLPSRLGEPLRLHLEEVKRLHQLECSEGFSAKEPLARPHQSRPRPPSPGSERDAKSVAKGGDRLWHHGSGNTAHLPAFFCDTLIGAWP